MSKRILVIGSVLLDMVGEYTVADKEDVFENKIGSVRLTVGGAAFNIAANLTAKSFQTSLVTCVNKNSPTADLLKGALQISGINIAHLFEVDISQEPAYVALLRNGDLVSGVTSAPMENADLAEWKYLQDAIRHSALVIIDTNLNEDQIFLIAKLCKESNRPMAVNIVSDAKAHRVYKFTMDAKHPFRFQLVSMNDTEAQSLGLGHDPSKWSTEEIRQHCEDLFTKWLLVTMGRSGRYVALCSDGTRTVHAPSKNTYIETTLGAGDALFSAACVSILENGGFTNENANMRIRDWVTSVLQRNGANLGPQDLVRSPLENRSAYILSASLCVAACGAVINTFVPGVTPTVFGVSLIMTAIMAGGAGALVGDAIFDRERTLQRAERSVFHRWAYGATAGLIAGLVSVLPHLSVTSTAAHLRTDVSELSLVTLVCLVFSLAAGLSFERVLKGLAKGATNDAIGSGLRTAMPDSGIKTNQR